MKVQDLKSLTFRFTAEASNRKIARLIGKIEELFIGLNEELGHFVT